MVVDARLWVGATTLAATNIRVAAPTSARGRAGSPEARRATTNQGWGPNLSRTTGWTEARLMTVLRQESFGSGPVQNCFRLRPDAEVHHDQDQTRSDRDGGR